VRLCLDEHYSSQIAEQLRARGHDVYAVSERAELRGIADRELWDHLQREGTALMTENVADFVSLVNESALAGEDHHGVIFTSARSLPRGTGTIGVFVERLDELVSERARCLNEILWLGGG
jgi:predicted nuclease of predicted toxin-antitoxin system